MEKSVVIQKVREALDKYESRLSEINQKVWKNNILFDIAWMCTY